MRFLRRFLDALFPMDCVCSICDCEGALDEHGLCSDCADQIKLEPFKRIDISNITCLISFIRYDDIARNCIHRFKFQDKRYLADLFAGYMRIPEEWSADVIVPVPLHTKRFRERGYNQAELLARRISEKSGIPLDKKLLCRIRNTEKQSLTESAGLRASNVMDAFLASNAAACHNIILVDDVCTTGSTLSECAKELKGKGAYNVYAVTACYAGISKYESDY